MMDSGGQAKIIAAVCTAVLAAGGALLLCSTYLSARVKEPPGPEVDITLAMEEYVEVDNTHTSSSAIGQEDASSYLEDEAAMPSQPSPASGADVVDAGPAGDAPPEVATRREALEKVREKTPETKKEVSREDAEKKQREEERRKADNEVANAFSKAKGRNNAMTSPTDDKGRSGNPDVAKGTQGTVGKGTGSVGGGWIIPKYADVRSTVTGSVKMVVKIDKTGRVVSVTSSGGNPPAASDPAVIRAVEREIRSRKFSRANYDNAEEATAYITYNFK